jgi:DNA-binding SARP family transcriptional activator/tetratricopeptide (TPR) repeat protein
VRLNTLGGIRVLADGKLVAGAAAQPRRLAVLALLARAGRTAVSREKILALLWPDEPDERARKSLNQAVYSLRRDLGDDDALVGSKDLRLNLELIAVDVIEFDDALQRNDIDAAIRLYAGPFLDGFFVPRAPELERWMENERRSLAHAYGTALERVAALATERGDATSAVGHWRKLAATDPLNGRIALSLMNALVAIGDVSGALQHARLHEVMLDQELGLPPDREVSALARELRARSASSISTADAPRPMSFTPEPVGFVLTATAASTVIPEPSSEFETFETASLPDVSPIVDPPELPGRRWWIPVAAVAAVAITGLAGWALIRGQAGFVGSKSQPVVAVGSINDYASAGSLGVAHALRDMLATNLARSPDLTVVSGSRLLEVERQMSGGAPPAPGAIVPAARQAGATALIDGALYQLGNDTLRLDLRVTSLRDGNVLRAYTITGRDAFALADSATGRLVAYLGSTAPSGSLADATTRSVAAYRLYEEGLRSFYLGDIASSERMFRAALGEDSTFAMAAYYFALASRTTRAEFLRRFRRAVSLSTRASERERLIIQGAWAQTNNLLSLRPIAETLATRYPTEVEGYYYLGRALVNAGAFLEAIEPLHRVERMDSLSLRGTTGRCAACEALHQQVAAYTLADSMTAAERVARRWIAARPNEWLPRLVLGRTLTSAGRPQEAQAAFQASDSLDLLGSRWEPMVSLWIHQGELARADELLRSALARGDDAANAHWFLAISLRYQGRLDDALGEARAYRRAAASLDHVVPGAADPSALQEAQVLRELGRYRESAALFDSISRFMVAGAETSALESGRVWSLTHEAGALAAGGDTTRLSALADTIEVYGRRSNLGRDSRIHHHVRGLLLAARGKDSMAVTEFRRATFSVSGGYTRTNVEMARGLIRLGRYADAVAVLEPALRGSLEASNLYVTYPEVRLLLAEAYAGAGRRDRANREVDWVRRAWVSADAAVRPQLDLAIRAVASPGVSRPGVSRGQTP